MSSLISKIRIGLPASKKSMFDLSNTNTTSSDFGFVQPMYYYGLKPDETITLKHNAFIRLAPMPTPTFAKSLKLRTYAVFVPYSDVMPSFEHFLSKKPYRTSMKTYVPSAVFSITAEEYTSWILCQSWVSGNCNLFVDYTSDGDVLENLSFQDSKVGSYRSRIITALKDYTDNLSYSFTYTNEDGQWKNYCNPDVTMENADFVLKLPLEYLGEAKLKYGYICFRFNRSCRNLRKILVGLGYQLDISDRSRFSFLPLLCYYKAYYDLFFPQRYNTWRDTVAFGIIDSCVENGIDNVYVSNSVTLSEFFSKLCDCYYTYSPDYFSAQVGTVSTMTTTDTLKGVNALNKESSVSASSGQLPSSTVTDSWSIRALLKLSKFINKNSIIGGRVSDYLRAHGLGSDLTSVDSNFLGSWSYDISVSDVNATTGYSDGQVLGDYAGKGIGTGDSGYIKFSSNCFGHLVVMSCIVPDIGYFQGTDPCNCVVSSPYDFYHAEFDALGMEVTRKRDMFVSSDGYELEHPGFTPFEPNGSFGMLPRYSRFKVKHNVINGDVSLRSGRSSLLPYTLDRFIVPSKFSPNVRLSVVGSDAGTLTFPFLNPVIVNGLAWRYLNKSEFLGNLNRIFYNSGSSDTSDDFVALDLPVEDNFIIHNYFDVNLFSPMKPLKDSFDTVSDTDNSSMDIARS